MLANLWWFHKYTITWKLKHELSTAYIAPSLSIFDTDWNRVLSLRELRSSPNTVEMYHVLEHSVSICMLKIYRLTTCTLQISTITKQNIKCCKNLSQVTESFLSIMIKIIALLELLASAL